MCCIGATFFVEVTHSVVRPLAVEDGTVLSLVVGDRENKPGGKKEEIREKGALRMK